MVQDSHPSTAPPPASSHGSVVDARDALWVQDATGVGAVRRRAARLAEELDLDGGAVSLAATELATNLVEHTDRGGFVQFVRDGAGLELICVDFGSLEATASPGLSAGLPSISRASSQMEIDGAAGGAVVRCRFGAASAPGVAVGVCVVPMRGFVASGDGVYFVRQPAGWAAVLVDVLGHGAVASAERDVMMAALTSCDLADPREVLATLESVCRGGRGAALRWMRTSDGELQTFGVGNVTGSMVRGDRVVRLDERPGIVGRGSLKPSLREYPFDAGSRLVVYSDGLSTRRVRVQTRTHASVEAGRLLRDASRTRDDAAVLVVGGGPWLGE